MPRGSAPGERRGGRGKGTKNKIGQNVRELAQQYTESAIACLVEIYQDKAQPAAARRAAASDLLDRGHGKSVQTQIVTAEVTTTKTLKDFYGETDGNRDD